ncbi:MAG: sulfatase-like hydrolase/transferase [Nitrospirae bacterium]|nr:sulfatase-like hydrolase/transferase [Nitrospirota bacterium]
MQKDANILRDHYDDFISYIDRTFQDFIGQLEKVNIGDTVLILSSDHGESFDHGYLTHGGPFLYEQVTRIPLIIREPGQEKGQNVDAMVEQIDIPATVLDLANIPVPLWMEGRSLVPLLRGMHLQPKAGFSMNFEENPGRGHQIKTGSIAVWEGDHKLIHYLGKNESLLFNLKKDPEEVEDLVNKEPDSVSRLLGIIKSNLQRANDNIRNDK